MLRQQELVEPSPARRVIVPRGRGAWWGVDPSTRGVSIGFVARDGRRDAYTATFPPMNGAGRLDTIYRETRSFVHDLIAAQGPFAFPWPGVVHVEQASGKMENPNLLYAIGVIQAAIYAALQEVFMSPVLIETVVSGHWKRVACGAGNLYKPDRCPQGGAHRWRENAGRCEKCDAPNYAVLLWARANGYEGSSWDEADCWGIAEAARREIALDER